jgi:Predicted redox protein, regulator of disulfide bond formation
VRRGHAAGGGHLARDRRGRGTVAAEGDLDFRGTLAVSKEAPVGFRSIRLAFDLDTDASAEQVQTLIKLTERYCVVYQTLSRPAEMAISVA